ncbi:hypothetical protein AB0O72_15040, partial [Streptomyces sp. NPDC088106]
DKFMPFMDEPPGARLSSTASGAYGAVVRKLRILGRPRQGRHRHPGRETGRQGDAHGVGGLPLPGLQVLRTGLQPHHP